MIIGLSSVGYPALELSESNYHVFVGRLTRLQRDLIKTFLNLVLFTVG